DQNDFVIDSPMSTRNNEDFSKIIGWLTGILISRIKIDNEVSFKDLLFSSKNDIIEAMEHIYYQFFISQLNIEWDELISAQLNLINDISTAEGEIVDFKPYHYKVGHVSSDINFNVKVFENGITINCSYKNNVIDKSEISDLCEKFVMVLKNAISSSSIKMKYWR
ncbi:condensation domain-containing protein, partial [uncultured Aquimarina sp.]|uniref:condensation domain-containing protein n=1 Tax=uncultured Aquimarina sp. TaxID=575652 RepID=UPI002602D7FE